MIKDYFVTPYVDEGILRCFHPGVLKALILAGRGYHFDKPEIETFFYGEGYFMESHVPYDPEWLTPIEKSTIDLLSGMEDDGRWIYWEPCSE